MEALALYTLLFLSMLPNSQQEKFWTGSAPMPMVQELRLHKQLCQTERWQKEGETGRVRQKESFRLEGGECDAGCVESLLRAESPTQATRSL